MFNCDGNKRCKVRIVNTQCKGKSTAATFVAPDVAEKARVLVHTQGSLKTMFERFYNSTNNAHIVLFDSVVIPAATTRTSFFKPYKRLGRTISFLEKAKWARDHNSDYVRMDPGKITLWQEAVTSGNPEAAKWAVDLIRDLG